MPHLGLEGLAHDRVAVELEIARVDNAPGGRVDDEAGALGDRVRDRHELHLERTGFDHLRARLDDLDRLGRDARLFQLQLTDAAGKRARIDRLAQLVPDMGQRADMVFMGVGDKDRVDPVGIRFQPFEIGEDQIDAGRAVHIRESHAQIDNDQPLFPLWAVAVHIGVHANFAGTAEGEVDQSVTHAGRSLL